MEWYHVGAGLLALLMLFIGLGLPIPFALAAASTDAAGVGRMPVALPTQAGLVGITFFTQWLVLEPGANPLGLVTSAGAACRVGN